MPRRNSRPFQANGAVTQYSPEPDRLRNSVNPYLNQLLQGSNSNSFGAPQGGYQANQQPSQGVYNQLNNQRAQLLSQVASLPQQYGVPNTPQYNRPQGLQGNNLFPLLQSSLGGQGGGIGSNILPLLASYGLGGSNGLLNGLGTLGQQQPTQQQMQQPQQGLLASLLGNLMGGNSSQQQNGYAQGGPGGLDILPLLGSYLQGGTAGVINSLGNQSVQGARNGSFFGTAGPLAASYALGGGNALKQNLGQFGSSLFGGNSSMSGFSPYNNPLNNAPNPNSYHSYQPAGFVNSGIGAVNNGLDSIMSYLQ